MKYFFNNKFSKWKLFDIKCTVEVFRNMRPIVSIAIRADIGVSSLVGLGPLHGHRGKPQLLAMVGGVFKGARGVALL